MGAGLQWSAQQIGIPENDKDENIKICRWYMICDLI